MVRLTVEDYDSTIYSSTIASVRHKARSVAELARKYITPRAYKLFLAFIWLALIYVIVVFLDLTAATFVNVEMNGSGVAISATIFVALTFLATIIMRVALNNYFFSVFKQERWIKTMTTSMIIITIIIIPTMAF